MSRATCADLPVDSGFNLVTGGGRAEIEFEDTSTVYLGENSVLAFNNLQTEGNVPHTGNRASQWHRRRCMPA
jgi:hypothetical protein